MIKPAFFVQNVQGVLFIENFAFRNRLEIAVKINNAVNALFDGDPVMLDLPAEAPQEIPRMQLKDKEAKYNLNFSPIRIDFIYNGKGNPNIKWDSLQEEYLKHFINIVTLAKNTFHLNLYRMALVIKTSSEIDGGANAYVQQELLGGNSFFSSTFALEVHALERVLIKSFDVNRWLRIKALRNPDGDDRILTAEIDVNTLAEKPKDFGLDEVKDFCYESIALAKKSFSSCFGVSL